MTIAFHKFEDAEKVPQNVHKLIELLNRPLPDIQEFASLPVMSSSSIAMRQLQRIAPSWNCKESPADSDKKVLSVAGTILMTSASLEKITSPNFPFGPRKTIHQWYTLIRFLILCSYEEADTDADLSVIYPLGFQEEKGDVRMLASFCADKSLLSACIDILDHPEPELDRADSDSEGHEDEQIDETESKNEDLISEKDAGGEKEEEEEEDDNDTKDSSFDWDTLDRPGLFGTLPQYDIYSAKFFFGLESESEDDEPPKYPFAHLPSYSHILSASVAYQRRSWGIDLPVIGFQISKNGRVVQTHIAWIDPSDVQTTPTVHILRPNPDDCESLSENSASQGHFTANPVHDFVCKYHEKGGKIVQTFVTNF
ncbi:hypothetical protein ABKN59_006229 [Abortiporus biennis]